MTTITLTRLASGFCNVADEYIVDYPRGDQCFKQPYTADYTLPDGYTIGTNDLGAVTIYDATGDWCDMTCLPWLVSRAGNRRMRKAETLERV